MIIATPARITRSIIKYNSFSVNKLRDTLVDFKQLAVLNQDLHKTQKDLDNNSGYMHHVKSPKHLPSATHQSVNTSHDNYQDFWS